ncbi:oligosaccharyl transferase subunit ost3/OST6 [Physocladia obscura]|uniref:Oligosaccharyl transferase subunit ost3/OST6 n=1 Tax=Physocladia obscura TaxID=109957 RepID=A0AAD5SUC9_9FUNG|nr:oligosaccharyl transferase subunit ost3/OST6 [Physocladia obscura]
MKFLATIAAALLLVVQTACAYSSDYKFAKLSKALAETPTKPLLLDSKTYNLYTESPRNYSLFVVLTAAGSEFNCNPCKLFGDELDLITDAYAKRGPKGQAFFGSLDFAAGREVFHKLKVTSVPFVFHFPPTEGPNKRVIKEDYEVYDLNRAGVKAEDFAYWIVVKRPIDLKIYGTYALVGFGAVATIALLHQQIIAFVYDKKISQMLSLSAIVIFCSGYMWNQIRGPAFVGNDNGKPQLFAPGFQNQYVLESQLVGLIC